MRWWLHKQVSFSLRWKKEKTKCRDHLFYGVSPLFVHRSKWVGVVLVEMPPCNCLELMQWGYFQLNSKKFATRVGKVSMATTWRKWVNGHFKKKKIQYFVIFSKLIREILLFWNSIFSKSSYKKKKNFWSPMVAF